MSCSRGFKREKINACGYLGKEETKEEEKKCYYNNNNNNGCSWWLGVMVLQGL